MDLDLDLEHMDIKSRRNFVSTMMAAAGMLVGAPMLMGSSLQAPGAPPAGGAMRRRRPHRPPRPRPAGLVWVSGQGSNDGVPPDQRIKVTAPMSEHAKMTMDALKRSIERLGGTMDDFLYMQVFFCLPLDDSYKTPTGSAAFAAYQKGYEDLNKVYGTYWTGPHGAPPRNCQALSWIPGNSRLEIQGAAYLPQKP